MLEISGLIYRNIGAEIVWYQYRIFKPQYRDLMDQYRNIDFSKSEYRHSNWQYRVSQFTPSRGILLLHVLVLLLQLLAKTAVAMPCVCLVCLSYLLM